MSKQNKTVDRIQAVWNKLGGEDGVDALLNGEMKLVDKSILDIHPWYFKTITIGNYPDVIKIGNQLIKKGYDLGDKCQAVMNRIEVASKETKINLYMTTVKELTGKDIASYPEIIESVLSQGYSICPAEVGLQLRLQYDEQTYNEWIRIIMDPVNLSGRSKRKIFVLSRSRKHNEGKIWYTNIDVQLVRELFGAYKIVFMSRK